MCYLKRLRGHYPLKRHLIFSFLSDMSLSCKEFSAENCLRKIEESIRAGLLKGRHGKSSKMRGDLLILKKYYQCLTP